MACNSKFPEHKCTVECIQKSIAELHDEMFPDSKHISVEDVQFLHEMSAKVRGGKKLHPVEDCSKELANLKEALRIAKESLNLIAYGDGDGAAYEAIFALAIIEELEKK